VESIFVLPPDARVGWTPPEPDGWARRWTERLTAGTKEQIRFAKQQLQALGDAARPALEDALRGAMRETRMFGQLVSYAEVLGGVGDAGSARLLLEMVQSNSTPVVRSSAFEAIAKIGAADEALATELVALVPQVLDEAPRGALFGALAGVGSEVAVAELERIVGLWLDGAPGNDGTVAFNALLASDGPYLEGALQRLTPRLPAYPKLQAIALRVKLGERGFADEVRQYLDATLYPSAATRELALGVLAEHGEWDAVLAAGDAPARATRLGVISLLRRPDARALGVGEDLLDLYAQDADVDVAVNALVALVERGQDNRLDPFLRLLQGFPTAPGSMQALVMFSKPEIVEPRVAGILAARWPYCDVPSRMDALSALVRTGSTEAARFVADVALDETEVGEVRRKAATMLSNFGPVSVGMLLEIWDAAPSHETASWIVPGLGRYPEDPRVRAFLEALAGDPQAPDLARRQVIDLLPRILGRDGLDVLVALRDAEPRADVRRYLDWTLTGYF